MINDKSFSACNPPLSYQDAIDQMAEMVAENKRCEYSFDESLECILDLILVEEYDEFDHGDYERWRERVYEGEQSMIQAHKEAWAGTKFITGTQVKCDALGWIGVVVDDSNKIYDERPVSVKFPESDILFRYSKDGFAGQDPASLSKIAVWRTA